MLYNGFNEDRLRIRSPNIRERKEYDDDDDGAMQGSRVPRLYFQSASFLPPLWILLRTSELSIIYVFAYKDMFLYNTNVLAEKICSGKLVTKVKIYTLLHRTS